MPEMTDAERELIEAVLEDPGSQRVGVARDKVIEQRVPSEVTSTLRRLYESEYVARRERIAYEANHRVPQGVASRVHTEVRTAFGAKAGS